MFGIDDAIAAVSNVVDSAIKRIWPDATEIELAKINQVVEEAKQAFSIQLAQINVNNAEAENVSVFVSGWRPFVGWTCGAALAYVGLVEPLWRFFAVVIFGYTGVFPVIDATVTLQILTGMLGLAGVRTYEKVTGVSRK